ncbi:NAD(P)-dependent oxidoreductase [Haloechinothrix sp. YIM 98757]|uniref:NAD(P)-dependent oxidoreductase n=1 Tax=Haloechinothrix aidingensis TaxID=2752311 RepID=A0A837ZZY0_9PSEU|nr:NAD(P)-dependent oxidoreductase [Haloechinothrix aidingensis]
MSATTVGFIGLGIMGGPMAANLLAAGFDVVGYNRSLPARQRLADRGGHAAASVAEVAGIADVVVTMLPDAEAVEAVTLGTDGILANARPGTLYIDCSTVAPETARTIFGRAADREVGALDAPVSGGDQGAAEASLSIMVGGREADFRAARPVLDAMGRTVVHVGPAGTGQTVKAANQLVVAGMLQAVAEGIVFLDAHGVDTAAAVRVLSGGLAGNAVLDRKADGMLRRDFTPGGRLELHHKDLGIAQDAAREVGAAIPAGATVAQLVGAMVARGDGALDHSALLTLVEELSGRGER